MSLLTFTDPVKKYQRNKAYPDLKEASIHAQMYDGVGVMFSATEYYGTVWFEDGIRRIRALNNRWMGDVEFLKEAVPTHPNFDPTERLAVSLPKNKLW